MKFTSAIFCILLLNSVSFCQNRDTVLIIPGDRILKSNKLKNYRMQYDFIGYKDGVETKIGGIEDNFQTITNKEGVFGLRICHITLGTNNILDSGLCYLRGLKPIYHRSNQTKKKLAIEFNSERITGTISHDLEGFTSNELINYAAPVALFDSYYEDIIAKTTKFKKGALIKFAEYIYERGGIVWSFGKTIGKEKTTDKNGKNYWAWKIQFNEQDIRGKIVRTTTYLIRKKNREIISREYKTETSRIVMTQI